jgi:hypothetical protein
MNIIYNTHTLLQDFVFIMLKYKFIKTCSSFCKHVSLPPVWPTLYIHCRKWTYYMNFIDSLLCKVLCELSNLYMYFEWVLYDSAWCVWMFLHVWNELFLVNKVISCSSFLFLFRVWFGNDEFFQSQVKFVTITEGQTRCSSIINIQIRKILQEAYLNFALCPQKTEGILRGTCMIQSYTRY